MNLNRIREQLARLVAEPSVSSALPEWDQSNKGVIDLLANWCEDLGCRVEVQPVSEAPEKYNLIATLGEGENGLILSGHSDTVPWDADRWRDDPFTLTEADERWYGLGVCDMKGFFPIALAAMAAQKSRLRRPVTLIATADEESSMSGIQRLVRSHGRLGRYAIIGEPTGMAPVYQHKGILISSLSIEGRSGHSSNPALGASALEAMADALHALRRVRASWADRYRDPAFEVAVPTLNFGCIHGGDNANRICGHCELQFDVRLHPGMDIRETESMLRDAVAPVAEDWGVTIRLNQIFAGVPPFRQTPEADLVRFSADQTGQPPKSVAFATEAPFLAAQGIETVVLGPGHIDQAHQPNEYMDLRFVPAMQRYLEAAVDRYCTGSTPG
ncbi:acetylornithine deacetylase [Hahella sp. SMD15-11]|uniref:Acetylornithine deacetylase n=1 Tax=Thermohahella caldifontis TaxID=3142973 RepID=A0AB39UWK0_9GAMM